MVKKKAPAKKTASVRKPAKPENPVPVSVSLEEFEKHVERISAELRRTINESFVAAQILALGSDRVLEIAAQDHLFKFHVPHANRDIVQKRMVLQGQLPNAEGYDALALRLPRGGTFIDVGGYLGISASFFSKICDADKIHIFEPQKAVFEVLQRNLELNGVEGATIHQKAVLDDVAPVNPGVFRPSNFGNTPFLKHASGRYEGVSLDSMKFKAADVLHMDFAGPKLMAIKGAEKLIKKFKPFIILDKGGRDISEVIEFVLPLGYKHDQVAGLILFYPEA
ncbi:FkbM family methyltransferase [Aliiroseovarius sp. S253]|uniref:FkbM family methyltransferase n=1 Tax=Aliiroseovarius sp. S253 TaxID=3415133 RepID=UPI003C7D7F25